MVIIYGVRGVAQSGRVLALGARCRRFESCRPDHTLPRLRVVDHKFKPAKWSVLFCHGYNGLFRLTRNLDGRILNPLKEDTMSIDYTLHTHTIGFDGRNTPNEMILAARAAGLKTIGFSNHFIVHPGIKKSQMYKYAVRGGYANIYSDNVEYTISCFDAHYREIRALRDKYPDMNILCGMEMDWFRYPGWCDTVNYAVTRLNPDYIIGAMHFIDRNANGILNVHDIKNAPGAESRRLLREYYQNLIRLAEFDWRRLGFRFNWIAHFDLPRRVGLHFPEMEQGALDAIGQNGMPIELNTALIYNKNYGGPDERQKIMKQIAAADVPVLVSDDAHDVNRLGADFDEVQCLADTAKIQKLCMRAETLKNMLDVRVR